MILSKRAGLVFGLMAAITASCTNASRLAPTSEVSAERTTPAYRLREGDDLEISVWKNPDLSRKVTIRPEGMISLPLVNDVEAAGRTPLELRAEIAKRLSEFIPNPEVSVLVSKVHGFAVSVVGEVQNAGRYEIQGRTSVLEAIALAGGLSEFASRSGIAVLRGDQRIPFRYNEALAGGANANFSLEPGDIVVVP